MKTRKTEHQTKRREKTEGDYEIKRALRKNGLMKSDEKLTDEERKKEGKMNNEKKTRERNKRGKG